MTTEKTPSGQNIRKFSDVVGTEIPLFGRDLIGKTFTLLSARAEKTGFGLGYRCEIVLDGQRRECLFNNQVIVSKIERLGNRFPVEATVVRQGRYFDIR